MEEDLFSLDGEPLPLPELVMLTMLNEPTILEVLGVRDSVGAHDCCCGSDGCDNRSVAEMGEERCVELVFHLEEMLVWSRCGQRLIQNSNPIKEHVVVP